ncbi:hypothetical protein [Mycobacterium sp. 3519A]|jgi:hypothetical protein|uniref:hypothetical protein n=1 Tax=Mycobacterium sp. 3519A TaxID=2057184 RepID=UPI000C7C7D9A|nr:hypothetical protein [Mycobacterium sp. 3519A]
MLTTSFTRFATPALAAAVLGLGTLMTVAAPTAYASEKSDCAAKGGTYTETKIYNQTTGKSGTNYRCCVTDKATNTTSCTSTTVTNSKQVLEPTTPPQRVPLAVLSTDAQIQSAP